MSSAKARRVLPGFGLSLGFTLVVPVAHRADPAVGGVHQERRRWAGAEFWHVATAPRVVASYRLSFGASLLAAAINVVFGLLLAWSARALQFSRATHRRCADRPAVRAADGRRRHRADRALRPERLARPVSRAARHQGRLHAARRARRPHLHRRAVRRAHRAAGAGGSRHRVRGGRRQPRRHALADLPPRRAADTGAGAADGLCARLRARGRRVRLGDLHRRQPARWSRRSRRSSSSPSSSSTTTPARRRSPP